MNTSDIQLALRGKLGKNALFLGCYPSDYLLHFKVPTLRRRDLVIIINTLSSTSREEIGHWFTIVIKKNPQEMVYIFDSLGLDINILCKNLVLFLKKNNFFYVEYGKRVQPDTSLFCAFYSLYFVRIVTMYGLCKAVWCLNKNMTFVNLSLNDKFVLMYYLNNLNSRACTYVWRHTKPQLPIMICQVIKGKKK